LAASEASLADNGKRLEGMDNSEYVSPHPGQTVILVVDDEPLIVDLAKIVLEAEGYFILSANDGEEALVLCRKFPGTLHLLVSDVKMPNMDGLQLIEKLREERPGTKVLLMSGHVGSVVGHAILRKPFGPDVLKERVREMLLSGFG
jgi:CheY-like chemotaxis protein